MADNIATKDVVVHDETTGLGYKIVAGTPVPAHLRELYDQQVGGSSKAERAPAKDKAQRAPENTK